MVSVACAIYVPRKKQIEPVENPIDDVKKCKIGEPGCISWSTRQFPNGFNAWDCSGLFCSHEGFFHTYRGPREDQKKFKNRISFD